MRAMPSTSPFLAVPDSMIAKRGGQHFDATGGDGDAVGAGLGRHVHHVGLALGVKMGQ